MSSQRETSESTSSQASLKTPTNPGRSLLAIKKYEFYPLADPDFSKPLATTGRYQLSFKGVKFNSGQFMEYVRCYVKPFLKPNQTSSVLQSLLPSKFVFLFGAPGSGASTLTMAICKLNQINMVYVHSNVKTEELHDIYELAQKNRPCVVYFSDPFAIFAPHKNEEAQILKEYLDAQSGFNRNPYFENIWTFFSSWRHVKDYHPIVTTKYAFFEGSLVYIKPYIENSNQLSRFIEDRFNEYSKHDTISEYSLSKIINLCHYCTPREICFFLKTLVNDILRDEISNIENDDKHSANKIYSAFNIEKHIGRYRTYVTPDNKKTVCPSGDPLKRKAEFDGAYASMLNEGWFHLTFQNSTRSNNISQTTSSRSFFPITVNPQPTPVPTQQQAPAKPRLNLLGSVTQTTEPPGTAPGTQNNTFPSVQNPTSPPIARSLTSPTPPPGVTDPDLWQKMRQKAIERENQPAKAQTIFLNTIPAQQQPAIALGQSAIGRFGQVPRRSQSSAHPGSQRQQPPQQTTRELILQREAENKRVLEERKNQKEKAREERLRLSESAKKNKLTESAELSDRCTYMTSRGPIEVQVRDDEEVDEITKIGRELNHMSSSGSPVEYHHSSNYEFTSSEEESEPEDGEVGEEEEGDDQPKSPTSLLDQLKAKQEQFTKNGLALAGSSGAKALGDVSNEMQLNRSIEKSPKEPQPNNSAVETTEESVAEEEPNEPHAEEEPKEPEEDEEQPTVSRKRKETPPREEPVETASKKTRRVPRSITCLASALDGPAYQATSENPRTTRRRQRNRAIYAVVGKPEVRAKRQEQAAATNIMQKNKRTTMSVTTTTMSVTTTTESVSKEMCDDDFLSMF